MYSSCNLLDHFSTINQTICLVPDHVNPYNFTLQVEKKLKRHDNSTDVRSDRKKERSKERGESKCSRESSDSRKREKAQKDLKESKIFKEER